MAAQLFNALMHASLSGVTCYNTSAIYIHIFYFGQLYFSKHSSCLPFQGRASLISQYLSFRAFWEIATSQRS
uniref:Uncharacterized protein n=1 Tax=Anguilla anguilla TaxID=7936 RepID=A0A0E9RPB4_ANGAN